MVLVFCALMAVDLAACTGGRAPVADTPEQVVAGLYRTLQTEHVRGAPTAAQLELLAPYLDAALVSRLRAARQLHDAERARAPDEKPPYNDGDLFSSLFEGPTSYTVDAVTGSGDERRVPVRFTYAGAEPPVAWTDSAVVVDRAGRWVVADIVYGGQWDFASKGTLMQALAAAGGG